MFRRRVTRCGAPFGAALFVLGCSLQNFESLSHGTDELGAGGSAASTGGSGAAVAGMGGSATVAGGDGGAGGSPVGASGAGGASVGVAGTGTSAGTGGTGPGSGDAGTAQNLLSDPGFELGHVGWIAFGNSTLVDVDAEGRGGSRCISSINRTAAFEGPALRLETLVSGGATYSLGAWVRVSSGTQSMSLSLKTVCDGTPESYSPIVSGSANPTGWTHLVGEFTAPTCVLAEFRAYIEGPPSGISFYVDDVALYLVP